MTSSKSLPDTHRFINVCVSSSCPAISKTWAAMPLLLISTVAMHPKPGFTLSSIGLLPPVDSPAFSSSTSPFSIRSATACPTVLGDSIVFSAISIRELCPCFRIHSKTCAVLSVLTSFKDFLAIIIIFSL